MKEQLWKNALAVRPQLQLVNNIFNYVVMNNPANAWLLARHPIMVCVTTSK